jgi:acetylornithine deacetylase/succinyl-diaminopimelate desuccinylase-like protein
MLGLLGIGMSLAQAAPDWVAVEQESAELLSAYLQVDSTNPPGRETAAADFLGARLDREGIPWEKVEFAPGRHNLIARLKGSGQEPPLCLLSHTDVVTAEPERWPKDKGPLSGVIDEQGYIWGRGALDMKQLGAAELMVMSLLARERAALKRDIILLAVGDEEVDNLGIRHLVEHSWPQIGCSHVINEGGIGLQDLLFQGQTVFPISVGEKGTLWMKMVASGEPGHGSTPRPGTAPHRLMQALERLRAYDPDATFTDAFLELLGEAGGHRGGLAGFILQRPFLVKRLLKGKLMGEPVTAAALTDTIHITGFGGALSPNVLPGEVWANLDCRLLPGTDPMEMKARVEALVDDPQVRFEVLSAKAGNLSDWDDPFFRALKAAVERDRPHVVAGPVISIGFTDSIYLRPLGVKAYGLMPFEINGEELATMHGDDERIHRANLGRGVRDLYEAVRAVSVTQQP